MKKKFRAISIDNENWAWRFNTSSDCCEDEVQTLTIWKDKKVVFDKSYQYNRTRKRYKIRPSLIARFIRTNLK